MADPDAPLPRQGWAKDSVRLAAAQDDALVWPEFANDGDHDLVWDVPDEPSEKGAVIPGKQSAVPGSIVKRSSLQWIPELRRFAA